MAKEKVTLTIEAELLAEFRRLVGSRSLSAGVEAAMAERVAHLRHMAALDRFIAEYEAEEGPFTDEEMAWAARVFDEADAERERKRAAAREREREVG